MQEATVQVHIGDVLKFANQLWHTGVRCERGFCLRALAARISRTGVSEPLLCSDKRRVVGVGVIILRVFPA